MLADNITGLQHLGLPVTNIDQSKAFYKRLGFSETMVRELPQGDDVVRVVMLELNGFVLELYQLIGDDLAEIRKRQHGHIDHFALNVRDIQATWVAVQAAGLKILEDAPVFLPFWENGVHYFNILGPDGEKIEFNSIVPAP
ncbi:MAG: VOC family protein [Anaerolineaceae bacterium]|nr:VOC family protein [Anaerolineaceae bacterium]